MAQKPREMKKMAEESAGRECRIHIHKKTGALQQFTVCTASKVSEFYRRWVNLDGDQQVTASRITDAVESWPEKITNEEEEFYYHKEYYIRFCDKQ
eukprot:Seg6054.3 transcript_id=Seg6054.3/GoldUCD/mRNA.D3Y31 product="hypothetical protein" protein_id=Seg6054.3/GoldUCD/D3Y31